MTDACVLRSDLSSVYVDPATNVSIRAWIPEVHASPNCERAASGGKRKVPIIDIKDPLWCYLCTTDNPLRATMRLTEEGWILCQQPS